MKCGRLAALHALLLGAVALGAVPEARAERDHDVGVYFDPGGTTKAREIGAFVTFHAYVIAWNLHLPSKSELTVAGFELKVDLDPRLIVADREMFPFSVGADPIDADGIADDENWIVRSARCLEGFGRVRLLHYLLLLADSGSNVEICVRAAEPPRLPRAIPGWIRCDDTFVPLGLAESEHPWLGDGCAIVNPSVVASERRSWSSVKATFTPR